MTLIARGIESSNSFEEFSRTVDGLVNKSLAWDFDQFCGALIRLSKEPNFPGAEARALADRITLARQNAVKLAPEVSYLYFASADMLRAAAKK